MKSLILRLRLGLLLMTILLFQAALATQQSGSLSGSNQRTSNPSATATEEDTCGNPDYADIKAQLLQHYDIFDSFYKLPHFANASRLPRQAISDAAAFLADRTVCEMLQNQPIGLDGRDPCPGVWQLSRDPNRVPCLYREFKCHCTDCLLPPGLAGDQGNRPQCRPIYNYVPVMRRFGNNQWTYALEPLVIACTCAGRRPNQIVPARWS